MTFDTTIISSLITVIGTIIGVVMAQKMAENAYKKSKYDNEISHKENHKHIEINKKSDDLTKERGKQELKEEKIKVSSGLDKDFIVGIILTLLCAIIFGISHVIGKHLVLETNNPIFIATIRNVVSGLFILIVSIITLKLMEKRKRKINFTIDSIYMVIGRSLSAVFYFLTLMYLSASSTITLYKFNTIFTFIILIFRNFSITRGSINKPQ